MLCSLKFPPLEKGEKHTKKRVPQDKKIVKKHRSYWERQLQCPSTRLVYSSSYSSSQLSQSHNDSSWYHRWNERSHSQNSRPLKRRKDSNVGPLVRISIIVVVAIVIVIVVVLMGEFCGGLWLHPLSQDLFSARV